MVDGEGVGQQREEGGPHISVVEEGEEEEGREGGEGER